MLYHDIHTHSTLSACCSDPTATAEAMIAAAARTGLHTLGFSDHMWDARIPGASSWYAPQTYERLIGIRQNVPESTNGVRVLIGCETEYCGHGKVGISREVADRLDYVLIPFSHFHMKGFVVPPDLAAPADVAALMVSRCREVLDLGLATGLSHPFLPCGHRDDTDEIIAAISDDAFAACFRTAAARSVSVEITLGYFPGLEDGERPGCHDAPFLRMLAIARDVGACFHLASDTHTLAGVGGVNKLASYLRALDIGEAQMLPLVRAL